MRTFASVITIFFTLFVLFSVAAALTVPTVQFRGSLVEGVDQFRLRRGGASISVTLSTGHFLDSQSADQLKLALATGFSAPAISNFAAQIQDAFRTGSATISGTARQVLRVRLGPMPQLEVRGACTIHFFIPHTLIEGSEHVETEFTVFASSLGTVALVSAGEPIAGNALSVSVAGVSAADVHIVQGTSCHGEDAAISIIQSTNSSVLQFVPFRGGHYTFCRRSGTHLEQLNGALLVAGAEGFATDPPVPRATARFYVNIFGTGLTDQDSVALTLGSCSSDDIADHEMLDFAVSSASRAGFFTSMKSAGVHAICYQRAGATNYVSLGSITVDKGGESVVDRDANTLVVDQDTLVLSNAHVKSLTVAGGTLVLDHHHINVSHLSWTGGAIVGPGTVTIVGQGTIACRSAVVIDFTLRNHGHLEVRLGGIAIGGTGAIINGHRLLLDGSAPATSPTHISGRSESHMIRNLFSGTIVFRGPAEGGVFAVTAKVESSGHIIAEDGAVSVASLVTSPTSTIDVAAGASLHVLGGTVRGPVKINSDANLFITTTGKGLVELQNTEIHTYEGSRVEAVGSVLLSGASFDGMGVVAFGDDMPSLSLSCIGTNYFGPGTSTTVAGTVIAADRSCILNFNGHLTVHLEHTHIWSNVVLQSRLSAVMFARGVSTLTRLVPQQVPQNTSLYVPANSSLVIVDTANYTQTELLAKAARPVVCSYYVVVPMYVVADGDILLRGCAMLPFGGRLNGNIFGATDEQIEAAVRTAFCHTVLQGDGGCLASEIPTGLFLRGPFTSDRLPAAASTQFDMDHLRIDSGSLVARGPLNVKGSVVHVDGAGALVLNHGGLFEVDAAYVLGRLEVVQGTLRIDGLLDASGGVLRLPAAPGCGYNPLEAASALYNDSTLQCSERVHEEMMGSMVVSRNTRGRPVIDAGSCVADQFAVRGLIDSSGVLSIFISDASLRLSRSTQLSTALVAVLVAVSLAVALGRWSLPEFLTPPPVNLDLMWTEYSMFVPNIVAGAGLFLEAGALCLPALIHENTTGLAGWFARLASAIVDPREHHSTSFVVTTLVLTVLWGLAWVPLSGRRFSTHVKELLANYQEHPVQRAILGFLFQLHTIAALITPALFIPGASLLAEVVACHALYPNARGCERFRGHPTALYIFAFILYAYLVPYTGSNTTFPFSHPPLQRELDIRFQRSYQFVKFPLLAVIVILWKVFAGEHWLRLCVSLVGSLALFALTVQSRPTLYRNVNSLASLAFVMPAWALLCAMWVARVANQISVCAETTYLFTLVLLAGWVAIAAAMIVSARRSINNDFHDDAGLASYLRVIMEGRDRVEECKADLYSAASARDRETISHSLTALRIRHLQHLTIFRHKKEALALPYLLGDELGRSLLSDATPTADDDLDFDAGPFDAAIKCGADREDAGALSVDLMDSYVRGPALGSGSYGVVYMGMLANGKLVAVKEIRVSHKKKDSLQQVKKEVNVLRTFAHTNVIRYYGCHHKAGTMYVFMEFAVGGSLTSFVRKFGRLVEPVICLYTQQILTGLAYLHSKGIVHRDIKGENILIDSVGTAKLADFGCSKALADIANMSREGCGTLIGSPYWMAPEVIKSEAYGTKADIWSVGCTVVEMLNGGEAPWHERFESAYAAMYFIGNTTDVPTNIPAKISEGCREFLARCFERDPSKRADAAELLAHRWLQQAQSPGLLTSSSSSDPARFSQMFDSPMQTQSADASANNSEYDSFDREMSSFHECPQTVGA